MRERHIFLIYTFEEDFPWMQLTFSKYCPQSPVRSCLKVLFKTLCVSSAGTRVLILEKSNDGWWRGHYNGLVGWFPSNYTTEEPTEEDHTYTLAENVLDVVVALYSFTAQNEHELSFTKGERMEILDRPPSDPEWYRARNTQGQVRFWRVMWDRVYRRIVNLCRKGL